MFKWHFDDISLACLTFGEFHFSCALHLILADPFLILSSAKHYFYDFSPISRQNPPGLQESQMYQDSCKRHKKLQRESLDCLSSLGTELKSMRADCFDMLSHTMQVSDGC